jgi:hypothetical protein
MEILISVFIGVLIMEGYAWLEDFAKWLLERAACQVSAEERDRCREEWNADLDAMPNSVVKVVYALRNFSSGTADRINADLFADWLEDINGLLEDILSDHRAALEKLSKAKLMHDASKGKLDRTVTEGIVVLKSKAWPNGRPSEPIANSYEHLVIAFETFGCSLVSATSRAQELMDRHIEKFDTRLGHVESLLEAVSAKHYRAKELSQHPRSPPDDLLVLLDSISNDLAKITGIMKDDQWGDDDAMSENARIMKVVEAAVHSLKSRPKA